MNKIVLITGASLGFGKTIALFLASKGFTVYGTSRGEKNHTSPFTLLPMDVRDQESVQRAVDTVIARSGRIDVLINNAGISSVGPIEETSEQIIRDIMETNFFGVLRLCRTVLPWMRKQNEGLIINTSSIGGLLGLPFRGVYSASKFAVEGLTEALSMEVKPFNIRVCLVEPGDFSTDIGRNRSDASLPPKSPYKDICTVLGQLATIQVEEAPSPEKMGPLIHSIIEARHPRLRYKIGSPMEKLSPEIKKIMPGRWFEKMIMHFYRLKF